MKQCAFPPNTYLWFRCTAILKVFRTIHVPMINLTSGQSWDLKMKMSKSLRVFESSIIRSEKLFNLISQVKHMHKIKWFLDSFFLHSTSKGNHLWSVAIWNNIQRTVLHISVSKLTKPFVFQIVFFNTSEALMLPPGQKATSLYTLMLFNSTTYCLTYLYSLVTRWYNNSYEPQNTPPLLSKGYFSRERVAGSNLTHLSMTTVKFVLEWTKVSWSVNNRTILQSVPWS